MEFIEFNQDVIIDDIVNIIKGFNIEYKTLCTNQQVLLGVSNGLLKVDETVCFVECIKNIKEFEGMKSALILTNNDQDQFYGFNIIYVEDARFTFIKLLEFLQTKGFLKGFSSTIGFEKQYISQKASIHPSVIFEENVVVEDNCVVSAGCVLKNGTYIGKNTIVRENCTIGCDGIALYKAKNGEVLRFPHVAGVYIANDVEIGAGCVIVRGTLANSVINENTVIGNLSNIGHGVKIGKKVWISVGAMVGGNSVIEDNTTIGLSVSIKDNVFIANGSTIGMGSVVTKSIKETTTVFGNPAKSIRRLNVGPKR